MSSNAAVLFAAVIAGLGSILAALIALFNHGKLTAVEQNLSIKLAHLEGQVQILRDLVVNFIKAP